MEPVLSLTQIYQQCPKLRIVICSDLKYTFQLFLTMFQNALSKLFSILCNYIRILGLRSFSTKYYHHLDRKGGHWHKSLEKHSGIPDGILRVQGLCWRFSFLLCFLIFFTLSFFWRDYICLGDGLWDVHRGPLALLCRHDLQPGALEIFFL